MSERETQRERDQRIDGLAREVLHLTRNTLYARMRFLDLALHQLDEVSMNGTKLSTDGEHLMYNGRYLLYLYQNEKEAMTRNYLHLIMHCIFRHMYVKKTFSHDYWNLACDMAVESMITDFQLPATQAKREKKQEEILRQMKEQIHPFTAEKIYYFFIRNPLGETKREEWSKLFRGDDHHIWYVGSATSTQGGNDDQRSEACDNTGNAAGANPSGSTKEGKTSDQYDNPDGFHNDGKGNSPENGQQHQQEAEEQNLATEAEQLRREQQQKKQEQTWKDIAQRMQTELQTFGLQQSQGSGSLEQSLAAVNREKYDYGAFLKKFASRGEVMQMNDDEFDYIAYTYGLQLYKKMPLIEPLEYKEVKRIKEFVIAIDTSGSVAGELVQQFIQKTYNILKSTESFFAKINLHIVQCDEAIKEHVKITSQKEFDEYMNHMTLRGFGGTDFRPVFELVDELVRNKEFENLKGLLYFTDGQGTFPIKKPEYTTAFVFVSQDKPVPEVPSWAISLVLEQEDIEDIPEGKQV